MYIPGLGLGPEVEISHLIPATEGRPAVTELGERQSKKPCPGLRGGSRSGKTPSEDGVFTLTVTEFPRWSQRKGGQVPECEGLACLGEEIRLDPAISREPREVLSRESGTSGHLSS